MKRLLAVSTVILATLAIASCGSESAGNLPQPTTVEAASTKSAETPAKKKVMEAFHSESELAAYLRELATKQQHYYRKESLFLTDAAPAPAAAPAKVAGLASANAQESITNVQHAGVDEGGIVKVHGNHLVVLRRGRLFTISIEDRDLTPISAVDAFGPEIDPRSTWYDEMLVSDDSVVVIGYSYERGGTEVGLFRIDDDGTLTYRSTYQLRSSDYYSSRNYASRLIGNKLIFYSPLYLYPNAENPFQGFPAMRKWHKGATPEDFRRIVPATRVYRPYGSIETMYQTALHTVTVCDLAASDFDCRATSVIGPAGRVFYVSPQAVYVWMTDWNYPGRATSAQSMLYRMPLDGSAPSALNVSGSPVDQFSFLESEDGHLNVLVRSGNGGDGMWHAENASGSVSLMRIAIDSFSDGSATVSPENYLRLPRPNGYAFQNRFVGDYLLYGTGSGWGYPQRTERSRLFVVRWATGDVNLVPLDHGTDRIEAMGSDAVVVGSDGSDLHFTAVHLDASPEAAGEYIRKGASQGELRSHGFFYKPDSQNSGMLGLPVSLPGRAGYEHLFQNSAAILFLKNKGLHFEELGELGAQPERTKDDACRASCVDWYGNSQPIFLRGRIIALLGYELVEGSIKGGRIEESRRVNYAPDNYNAFRR
jgi:hypothetical protein